MRYHMGIRRVLVAAAAAAGLVAAPLVASASTRAAVPHVPPATPTAVALSSGNRSLLVSWSESSGGTPTYIATAKAPGRVSRVCKVKKTSCTIAALVNGVVYDVTVIAKNLSGASGPSADTTAIVGVPGPPLSIHTTGEVASASIAWAPPLASGVAKVTGYMATAEPGGFSCSTAATVVSAAGRTCEIAGLSSGISYTITVTATNAFGTGVPSRSATVVPT